LPGRASSRSPIFAEVRVREMVVVITLVAPTRVSAIPVRVNAPAVMICEIRALMCGGIDLAADAR
jgi:hypothetical protein